MRTGRVSVGGWLISPWEDAHRRVALRIAGIAPPEPNDQGPEPDRGELALDEQVLRRAIGRVALAAPPRDALAIDGQIDVGIGPGVDQAADPGPGVRDGREVVARVPVSRHLAARHDV